MNSKYINDLPKAVRNIINEPSPTYVETNTLKMSDACKSDYIDGLCAKFENLKAEKHDSVAYGDILQVFTDCTDEYGVVFNALEALNAAVSTLVAKVDSSPTSPDDFIAYIMHKELVTNINTEICRITAQLKKSTFFKPFLDTSAWRTQVSDKLPELPREKSRTQPRPSNVVGRVTEIQKASTRDRERAHTKAMAETLPARVIPSNDELLSADGKATERNEIDSKKWEDKNVNTPVSSRSQANENRDPSTVS